VRSSWIFTESLCIFLISLRTGRGVVAVEVEEEGFSESEEVGGRARE